MGFHEKSAWFCLVAIFAAYIPYFYLVFQYPMSYVGLFVCAVVLNCVLLIAFHATNSIWDARIRERGDVPKRDELDSRIELVASKFAGIVLAVVVLLWCVNTMIGIPFAGAENVVASGELGAVSEASFAIPVLRVATAIHLLFAGFIVSNVVYYGTIVIKYRRITG